MSTDIKAHIMKAQIKQAAPRKDELQQIIRENDSGPDALQIEEENIKDLQQKISRSSCQIQILENRRIVVFKDHEQYRTSHMKRFAYTATGKKGRFDEKAEEQERRYLDSLEREQKEQKLNSELTARIGEAREGRDKAEDMTQRYRTAKEELDALYASIFDGPTPDFPEEDEKEQGCSDALNACQDSIEKRDTENKAINLLKEASSLMYEACRQMHTAQNNSRMDVMGGGLLFDVMERRALAKAQKAIEGAKAKVGGARKISPLIVELPGVNINRGHILSDVIFDNFISDIKFHREIKRGRNEVEKCATALKGGIAQAKERQLELQEEVDRCESALKDAKDDLHRTREEIFERVAAKDIAKPT